LVSLRTAASDQFVVCGDDGEVIGQVDGVSAPLFVYPGAVYLHEGQAYLVSELDWDRRLARVHPTEVDHFTEVAVTVKVEVLGVQRCESRGSVSHTNADVRVITRTTGYREVRLGTHEPLAAVPLDMPEQQLLTQAYWLNINDELVKALRDEGDWTIAPILSYGPNWAKQRQRARERDGRRCRNCGRPELPEREHDVHHLRPFRTFDYRPGENAAYLLANRLSNLITLCPECHRRVETMQSVQGTLEGLGHVLRALAPLYLMCDPQDLRLTTDLDFAYTRAPTVIVYDAAPGGVGFSRMLYELRDDLLRACLEWVGNCPCAEGCPACIGAPPQTGAGAKARVRRLLERISGAK
jgi:DEAD/DEAH box helicase domain-containing protein